MSKSTRLLSIVAVAGLSGCGSVVSGTTQPVFVETPKVSGAICKLSDSKSGRWSLDFSPGTVTVQKGDGPMTVACEKGGHEPTAVTVEETIAGVTFGNILIGGGIGFIVDAASGAAQRYPDKVVVWLKPESFPDALAEQGWHKDKRDFEMAAAAAETLKACQQANGEHCEAKAKEAAALACKANRGTAC
ncbi:MAG: hypothetical protein H7841_13625 [Magnetospirillum sp. WYHS-4]